MITRCPCCGAASSLEVLINNRAAFDAVSAIAQVDAGLANDLLIYSGLHRPAKYALSFDRLAKLLDELLPDIRRQMITHNGQDYPAPVAVWKWAIADTLRVRDEGRLKLPLKGHGWLYGLIRDYRPPEVAAPAATPIDKRPELAEPVRPVLPTAKSAHRLG